MTNLSATARLIPSFCVRSGLLCAALGVGLVWTGCSESSEDGAGNASASGGAGGVGGGGGVGDSGSTDFVRAEANPIINPREVLSPTSGTYNLLGTPDPCAVWDPDASLWRVYWSFFDVYAEEHGLPAAGIMGATSPDGVSFTPLDALSLQQQGTFDAGSVETCDVVIVDDPKEPGEKAYYMFYSAADSGPDGEENVEDYPIYRVGLATSKDGRNFTPLDSSLAKDGTPGLLFSSADVFGDEDTPGNFVTDPTVVVRDGQFHMWSLCIQQVPTPNGGICYHSSPDGIEWTHHGIVTGLERAFPIQPTAYFNPRAGVFEMYVIMDTPEEEAQIHDYETNLGLIVQSYRHATSLDGITWTETSAEPAFQADLTIEAENRGLATGPDAEYHDGKVYLFYPSFSTLGGSILADILNWPLNLATRNVP